jgi:hypothetical protein
MSSASLPTRLQRALYWHQRLHTHEHFSALQKACLQRLQQWQQQRLSFSFRHFLADPQSKPAAEFFLSDVYTSADTKQRDASAYRLIPSFQRWLPSKLEPLLADAFMLGALSRALDEKLMLQLDASSKTIRADQYAEAYQSAGYFRARRYQIDLIEGLGLRLSRYAQKPGVHSLLIASRLPARLAGAMQLQNFLERGYQAFIQLKDPDDFVRQIVDHERAVRASLMAGDASLFAGFQSNS